MLLDTPSRWQLAAGFYYKIVRIEALEDEIRMPASVGSFMSRWISSHLLIPRKIMESQIGC
jgi:hypothetical protein